MPKTIAFTTSIEAIKTIICEEVKANGKISSLTLSRRCGATCTTGQQLTAACVVINELTSIVNELGLALGMEEYRLAG